MRRTSSWLHRHGLNLATDKTELVLLTRRQISTDVLFQVQTEQIKAKGSVKYLGVRLDNKLTYWEQIRHTVEKASKVTLALSRLMANTSGPTAGKRRLLMSVSNSILLYGCEIWADSLKKEKYRKQMASVQRRGALRIVSSYRTVSEPAVLVIAGVLPIDLMAQERKRVYETKTQLGKTEARKAAKEFVMGCWQERWETENRGRWTARLIENVAEWVNRKHGDINYYITQFLTGHGYFCMYLHTMGKVEDASCIYCNSSLDDAQHTFFICDRWRIHRKELEEKIGAISPENIIKLMLASKKNWDLTELFVESILRAKKPEMDLYHQAFEG